MFFPARTLPMRKGRKTPPAPPRRTYLITPSPSTPSTPSTPSIPHETVTVPIVIRLLSGDLLPMVLPQHLSCSSLYTVVYAQLPQNLRPSHKDQITLLRESSEEKEQEVDENSSTMLMLQTDEVLSLLIEPYRFRIDTASCVAVESYERYSSDYTYITHTLRPDVNPWSSSATEMDQEYQVSYLYSLWEMESVQPSSYTVRFYLPSNVDGEQNPDPRAYFAYCPYDFSHRPKISYSMEDLLTHLIPALPVSRRYKQKMIQHIRGFHAEEQCRFERIFEQEQQEDPYSDSEDPYYGNPYD